MPCRRALPIAAVLAAAALLASGCSIADHAGGGAHAHHHQASPATRLPASPHHPGPARATAAPVRVVMNDNFRYQPASIMVRAGRRVTFAVHNAGRLPHEFILGDRAAQLDHEHQMQSAAPGTTHDHMHDMAMHDMAASPGDAGALTVPPGATRRLTWTFDKPGIVLYGCHVVGHWAAGMKGTIVVVSPDRPTALTALSPSPPSRAQAAR
jgi:uncharacterized cupredoxin-like copper-binding protein